ncbi:MAG: ATP-binding cassette domain-containing protein [Nitrospiraceae bacterium]|nr:ATP-binding cassette domain-containing protein [Nitrospiraceae bacterium]
MGPLINAPLIKAEDIRKYFPVKKGVFGKDLTLKAVDGVSLEVAENSVVGVVGESGSGKSTLARIITALDRPTSGNVLFRGKNVFGLSRQEMLKFRRAVQIIFQDPFASLNPRATVFETIAEPLKIHRLGGNGKKDIEEKVAGLLSDVGLGPEILRRYPHEFSGGQRQRICIARALAVSPRLVIADEPLSALDVSIQAQILNILSGLKKRDRLSFVFISHDLRVVEYLSDVVAVMYLGKIVEKSEAEGLFGNPLHPYTVGLFASAPSIKMNGVTEEIERRNETPAGDIPSPIDIPQGCPFHPRCPRRFAPCDKIVPGLAQPAGRPGRLVSCHLWNPY